MELDYGKIFRISEIGLHFLRAHPETKRDKKWMLEFGILHGINTLVFVVVMYNIIFVNIKASDFSETCKNGTLAVVYLTISFKYFIMLWKQQYLIELINDMKEDYKQAKQLSDDEQEIIQEYANKGTFVCRMWMVVTAVTVGSFPVKHFVMTTFYWIIGDFRLMQLYDLVYPVSFIEDRKDTLLVFFILYCTLLFYGIYSSVMITAFVALSLNFMVHACGQLEVVTKRIENLFVNDNIETTKMGLIDVVKRLQYIYDFVDRVKLCYMVAYDVILKSTVIVMPISAYEVIAALKKGEVSLEFLAFILAGIMLSSTPCYYSELMMTKGEELRQAMYSCGWENMYDRGIRNTIRIVLLRAMRPVAIRSLFQPVCLTALTDVYQQSYAIFNLMNAAWS